MRPRKWDGFHFGLVLAPVFLEAGGRPLEEPGLVWRAGVWGSTGVPAGLVAEQRLLTAAPSPSVLLPPLWDSGCLCTWPGSPAHRACGVHCGGPSSTLGPRPHRGFVDFVGWVNSELVSEGPVGPLEVGDWPPLSETPVGGRGGPDVGVVRKLRPTLCLILKF